MKATDHDQYFPGVLFVMLNMVALTFESVDEILKCDHSNERYWVVYFPVVLFIMLYKVFVTFESVGEILEWDPSIESYWSWLVYSFGAVHYAVQDVSNFWVCVCDHSNKSYRAVLCCGT